MAMQPELQDWDVPTPIALVQARDLTQKRSFEVPQQAVLLHARCPSCRGNTYAEYGEIRCMLCARELHIAVVSDTGRVLRLASLHVAPILSRAGYGERQRVARTRARDDGLVGLAARVLRRIPESPEYTVVERLAKEVAAHREDVREALDALEGQRLVERFEFRRGYRVGWRRPRRDDG